MEKDKARILILDDEENNLISFTSAFRKEYTIFAVQDHHSAYRILEDEEIHIVISDQRMPSVSGVDFLESVVQRHPETVRMLLTGFDDFEPAIEALNRGAIYRYISKPWDEVELRLSLKNAYATYKSQKLVKQKNRELEKAYKELDQFVYRASHDIRGPLMGILGITELIELESTTDTTREYVSMINESVHRLDTFVQNMVDYSKNARIQAKHASMNVEEVVKRVLIKLSFTEPLYNNAAIELDYKGNERIVSDESRVEIILSNLLSNAIKYADNEREEKHMVKLSVSADEDGVEFIVRDNGVGIDKSQIEDIFKMFYRGTELSQGSGIGLYIVQEAVNRLNGTILVDSEVHSGTTITVTIPRPTALSV